MDIHITKLTKDYGKFRALDEISFEVNGGMFGLLGPNGAGKTTLMRILATLLPVTSGQVTAGPYDVMKQPEKIRQMLGYLPQEFGFYKNLNAFELLDYIATMKNVPRAERKRQIESLLEQVNLAGERRRVGTFSGGMKQRLGIAQALLGNPRLLVIDEPTAGLDPEERIRFRNLLARLSQDRTVLLSTHIVADVEASCAGVAILNKGRLLYTGSPDRLTAMAHGLVWQIVVPAKAWETVETHSCVVSSRSSGGDIEARVIASQPPADCATPVQPSLEDGYIAVMKGIRSQEAQHV